LNKSKPTVLKEKYFLLFMKPPVRQCNIMATSTYYSLRKKCVYVILLTSYNAMQYVIVLMTHCMSRHFNHDWNKFLELCQHLEWQRNGKSFAKMLEKYVYEMWVEICVWSENLGISRRVESSWGTAEEISF
jgi:hypothetical protein